MCPHFTEHILLENISVRPENMKIQSKQSVVDTYFEQLWA